MSANSFITTTGNGIARARLTPGGEWLVESLLTGADVRCLAADPLDPNVVYAGTQGNGLLRSRDGGKSWHPAGLPGQIVKSVAVSRLAPGTVYAGIKPPALFVSLDGGTHWSELEGFQAIPSRENWFSPAEPPGTAYAQAIALSPTDPDLLLVGIEFGAVVRSADGGRSWTDHREGALPDCHTLLFHATDGNWVYEGGSAGAGAAVSRDAGLSWEQPEQGLDCHYGWAVAADPARPDLWYVSVSPSPMKAHGGTDAQAAIFRWRGGGPWQRLSGGLPEPLIQMPYALLTDPAAPGHLYAGLSGGDVWHSSDRGDRWEKLPFSLGRIHHTMILV